MSQPFNRRTFLKSSGVVLALPMLELTTPALASNTAGQTKRLVSICATLGLYSPSWFPTTTGYDYEPSEYLTLLDSYRNQYTVLSGLGHEEQTGRQPHNSEITWLTAARRPGMDGFRNSISVDQVVAKSLGYTTRYPSVVLGTVSEQSQSYTHNGVMVPAETSPSAVFKKMFLQGTPEEIKREVQSLQEGGSILDHLKEQTTSLQKSAGTVDRIKLEQYFDAVRTAENDLFEAGAWLHRPKPKVEMAIPEDLTNPAELIGRIKLMFALIPLILETDSSRAISMMIQDHSVVPNVPGATHDLHNLSHHGQDPAKIAQLRTVENEIVRSFSELLERLSTTSDATGSLLDQTTVIFGSNLGNANSHDTRHLPILLAGGGYSHGQHVEFEGEHDTPLSNLFVSVLQWMGVETESFGQSTGLLTWA